MKPIDDKEQIMNSNLDADSDWLSACRLKFMLKLSVNFKCEIKKGDTPHFKSPTAERRHVLCVRVVGVRTHTAWPLDSEDSDAHLGSQSAGPVDWFMFFGAVIH